MERIAVCGLSLHETDSRDLERLRRPEPGRERAFLRELADGLAASETVYLATCNRVEVVFAREEGHLPCEDDRRVLAEALDATGKGDIDGRLHWFAGRDAARHLFRVAASLDSVVLGEDQILAQVREAHALARGEGLCGRLLGPVFEHAFQAGKEIRRGTELSRGPTSVASVGVACLLERLPPDAPVAVLGAGHMAMLAARALRDAGRAPGVVANRSLERARALAEEVGARPMDLEAFFDSGEPLGAVVAATSSPGTILTAARLARIRPRAGGPLLALDLAMPRDVEPCDDVRVIDIETVRERVDENRARRAAAVAEAERLVDRKLETLLRRSSQRAVSEALADVSAESDTILSRELEHLFTGRLAELDGPAREAVERWARTTFSRLSHVPISALKRVAASLSDRSDEEPAA